MLNAIAPQLSAAFFPEKERAIATSLGSLSTLIGLAASYSLSGFIIGNIDSGKCRPSVGLHHNITMKATILNFNTVEEDVNNFYWLFIGQGKKDSF